MNQFVPLPPESVTDRALPPERADIDHTNPFYNRAIERLLTDHIPSPSGSSMETLREQIERRMELFGPDYHAEYIKPVVRRILKDHAIQAPNPKVYKAKQSRRLP